MGVASRLMYRWSGIIGEPPPPPPPPPGGGPVMMADTFNQYYGMNTKSNYLNAIYGSTQAQRTALIAAVNDLKPRIVRESVVVSTGLPRTVQREFFQGVLGQAGSRIKWHLTMGNTAEDENGNQMREEHEPLVGNQTRFPDMTTTAGVNRCRALAIAQMGAELDELATFWWDWTATVAPGGIKSLPYILHSIGGPNEVDAGYESLDARRNTGPYWDASARVYQDELWRLTRSTGPYGSKFVGIDICAGSTSTDMIDKLWSAKRFSGWPETTVPDENVTFPGEAVWLPLYPAVNPGAPPAQQKGTLPGRRYNPTPVPESTIRQWCDLSNSHLYQGTNPQARVDEMLAAVVPIAPIGATSVFSETGYRTSGFDNDDTYVGNNTFQKGKPTPHWAVANYMPKCLAVFAKRRCQYLRFEMLDDPDPSVTRNSQESHLGIIGTTWTVPAQAENATPATWVYSPEFHAMRRFQNLTRDIGVDFTSTALAYELTVGAQNPGPQGMKLDQLLLQKRDPAAPTQPGRWFLVLWRDVDVWDVDVRGPGVEKVIPAVDVRLTFPVARTVKVYQPNEALGGGPPLATATTHGTANTTCQVLGPAAGTTVAATVPFVRALGSNLIVLEIW